MNTVLIRPLHPHQENAIGLLRQSLASGKRRPVVQLPTGAGKTRLAAEIVTMALAKGRRVCFTVPALSLIDQTLQAFWRDGVREVGVIQADHPNTDWSKPVQIASVQTLERRGFPDVDLVIVDECHKRFKIIEKWMATNEKLIFVGLSATPWVRGLGKFYDALISPIGIAQLTEQKYLAPFIAFGPSHPDLSKVRIQAGDYHEGDLSKAMDQAPLVGDVVETWVKLGENRPTLCYGVDRAHARHLQEKFLSSGIPCGYIDANTDAIERARIKGQLERGALKVVCNIATLLLGVDWDVRCISWARPTKSEMLFVQAIGRGLRTADGKTNLIWIDHADTISTLGFPDEIHHAELDDGKPKKKPESAKRKARLPTPCPKCSVLRTPGISACLHCGFKPDPPKKNHATVEGELREIRRGKGTIESGPKNTLTLRGKIIPLGSFYAQLKTYALDHGYKPGWASNQYRDATKTWPNAYRDIDPEPISEEVHSWIVSRMIRYSKGMKKREANMEAPADA